MKVVQRAVDSAVLKAVLLVWQKVVGSAGKWVATMDAQWAISLVY